MSDIPRRLPEHDSHPVAIHVPRTAGSSMWAALYGTYKSKGCDPQNIYDIERYPWLRPEKQAQIKAATSIISEFSESRWPTNWEHISVPLMLDLGIIRQEWWDQQWSFAFVRNPWERLVSVWRWKFTRRSSLRGVTPDFSVFVDELRNIAPIGAYASRLPPSEANVQLAWLRHKGKWLVDFIGRYENLRADWKAICKGLGISDDLPRIKVAKPTYAVPDIHPRPNQPWRDFYNAHTRRVVAHYYAEEIELFAYSFD